MPPFIYGKMKDSAFDDESRAGPEGEERVARTGENGGNSSGESLGEEESDKKVARRRARGRNVKSAGDLKFCANLKV